MAWDFVSVSTVATAASGNVTINLPTGHQQGDLLVACFGFRGSAAFTPPSGWQHVVSELSGDADATSGIASGSMYCIRRGVGSPGTSFTRTGGDVCQAVVTCYRDTDTAKQSVSSPCDTFSSSTAAALTATATAGSLSPSVGGCLIVAMASHGDNYTTSAFDAVTNPTTASGATDTTTDPSSTTWIERFDAGTITGADHGLAVADGVLTSGSTGTITATGSGSSRNVMIAAAFVPFEYPTITGHLGGDLVGIDDFVTLADTTLSATGELVTGPEGSLAVTLADTTLSATGALAIKADLSVSLGGVSAASTGALAISGAAAPTLADVTVSAAATLSIKGSADVTLGAVTLSSVGGAPANSGVLAVTLDSATLSAAGRLEIRATASITLDGITSQGTGKIAIVGSVASALADVSAAATGKLAIAGAAATTLDPVTVAGAGALSISGAVASQIGAVTLDASGRLGITGQGSVTLTDATVSASGRLEIRGSFAAVVDAVALEAAGMAGAIVVDSIMVVEITVSAEVDRVAVPDRVTGVALPQESATIQIKARDDYRAPAEINRVTI